MSKRLFIVIDTTNNQNGSVIQHLLPTQQYRLRGLTRNTGSKEAKELAEKGVEMVQADLNNIQSLESAFGSGKDDVFGVFAVTNSWDKEVIANPDKEFEQGKNIVDAAKKYNTKVFFWSSLEAADAVSNGKYKVSHFSNKNKIEQHIKTIGLPAVYLYPGSYMTNTTGLGGPKWSADGSTLEIANTINSDIKFPWFDVRDTGRILSAVLDKGYENWLGKRINMATEYLTYDQIAEAFTHFSGIKTVHKVISKKDAECFMVFPGCGELLEMFEWFNVYGYYPTQSDISVAQQLCPGLTTFEAFLKESGWKIPQQKEQ